MLPEPPAAADEEGSGALRGGDAAHVTLTTQLAGGVLAAEQEIVRVHDALLQLVDPRMA